MLLFNTTNLENMVRGSIRCEKIKGLRECIAPMSTLSENGYGERNVFATLNVAITMYL